jgi:carbon storage regulator
VLFLMRRVGESIAISGGITLTVMRIRGGSVRIGIQAPDEIGVHRTELLAQATDRPRAPSTDRPRRSALAR